MVWQIYLQVVDGGYYGWNDPIYLLSLKSSLPSSGNRLSESILSLGSFVGLSFTFIHMIHLELILFVVHCFFMNFLLI